MATSESPVVRRRDGVAVIDLAGDVDRGAEEALATAWAQAVAERLEVRAYGLTPHYREIFEITRLADFLAINPDEDSAVRGAEGSRDA